MNLILAAAIRLFFWTIRLLPVRLAGAIGAGLGRLAYMLDSRHRNVALANLARVYPDRDETWRIRIAHESFAETARTFFEMPHVYLRSREFLLSRLEVEGEEHLKGALALNRGLFITACHHSNWEMGSHAISMLGYPISIIYRPMNQKPVERYMAGLRNRFGAQMQSRLNHNIRWIPQTLKKGGAIAVTIDQSINTGMPVPFLGHMAATTTVPAFFALRQDVPIVGAALLRHGREFRFTLRFWLISPPQLSGDSDRDIHDFTEAISTSFEAVIHQRPELWLWTHRRWRLLEEPELFNYGAS